MTGSSRLLVLLVPCCLTLGLLNSCDNPAGPAPVACTQSTVFKAGGLVPAGSRSAQSFTTPSTGALDVTLDWGSDANIVNLILAQAPCTDDLLEAHGCNVLFSAWSPPKPLKDSTLLLPSGTYVLMVGNPNSDNEAISAQVILRSAGCPVP